MTSEKQFIMDWRKYAKLPKKHRQIVTIVVPCWYDPQPIPIILSDLKKS